MRFLEAETWDVPPREQELRAWDFQKTAIRFGAWMYVTLRKSAVPGTVGKYLSDLKRVVKPWTDVTLDSPRLKLFIERLHQYPTVKKLRYPLPAKCLRAFLDDTSEPLVLRLALLLAMTMLMRVGEYTTPRGEGKFNAALHATWRRIGINADGTELLFNIPGSKTDTHNVGSLRQCGALPEAPQYCAVRLFQQYRRRVRARRLACGVDDPLLVLDNGTPLRSSHVCAAVRRAVAKGAPELDVSLFSSHSLRSGGATALAHAGYSDRDIMLLGRWKSTSFLAYTRLVRSSHSRASRIISTSDAMPALLQ